MKRTVKLWLGRGGDESWIVHDEFSPKYAVAKAILEGVINEVSVDPVNAPNFVEWLGSKYLSRELNKLPKIEVRGESPALRKLRVLQSQMKRDEESTNDGI